MLNKKYLAILFLFALGLLLVACNSSSSKLGHCHVRDKRFVCHGNLQSNGHGELVFDKTPANEIFQISHFSLDKVDENGDSVPFRDCNGSGGDVKNGHLFKFDCQPLEPGTYYLKFKLTHRMPKSYQPRKSESCLLSRRGMITAWECTTGGEFKYIIK